jgi:hypothetical protein
MRNLSCLFLLVSILSFEAACQNLKASQAPAQSSFSMNPDGFQALQNSVNMLTGQVAFPMNLVSLSGRGGLNISVGIQYNSGGIKNQVDRDSEYSPTGILGLGWSMDIPRIVADFKQTGTRHDDVFYLIENDISNQLICTNYYSTPRSFVPKTFSPWKILYYPNEEKWIVTRENGFKYTYSAVQWVVKWGNWIGNSAQTQNQSRLAYVWALTEVENLYGDKLTFQYNSVEEAVGSGGQTHTKAFYLSKVIDAAGQSAEFIYQSKQPTEYFDPHVEQAEPDAYQEKFETQYLSTINVRSIKNLILYSVDLSYTLRGEGSLVKRYLTSVIKRFPSGETQPAMQFEYFAEGESNGYIKRVFNSLGAHVDYYYSQAQVDNANRNYNIAAPTDGTAGGYGQPKIYTVGSYVVVAWRKLKSDGSIDGGQRPVKVLAYHWDGQWNVDFLWDIPAITNSDYEQLDIEVAATHFVLRFFQSQNNLQLIYAAHKKKYTAGTTIEANGNSWEKKQLQYFKVGGGSGHVTGNIFCGDEFVGFLNRFSKDLHILTWKGEKWVEETISNTDESQWENFVTSTGNYIFVHNDNGGNRDELHLYFLDGEKEWQHRALPTDIEFGTDGGSDPDSQWHSSNSILLGMANQNPEYIFMWDENYQNFVQANILGRLQDAALVYISSDGQIGISQTDKGNGVVARYDGKNWYTKGFNYIDYKETSYGDDFLMWSAASSFSPICKRMFFNPNTLTWSNDTDYGLGSLTYDRLNDQYGNAIQAGIGFSIKNGTLHRRLPSGDWALIDNIPLGTNHYLIGRTATVLSPNYIAYEYSETKSGKAAGIYILYIKNNEVVDYTVQSQFSLGDKKTQAGFFVLASASTNSLNLCRVVDEKIFGIQTPLIVDRVGWTDGNRVFETNYEYFKGRINEQGIPQFNRATVIPGGDYANKPFGLTEYYFYNGLNESDLTLAPATTNLGKELHLLGAPYQVLVKNSNNSFNQEVARSQDYYRVFSKPIRNAQSHVIDSAYYVRIIKTDQRQEGINGLNTAVENTYDDKTGLLKSKKQINSIGANYTEVATSDYTYWWEAYDTDRSRNILSYIIQSKVTNTKTGSPTFTSCSATKWIADNISDPETSKYYPQYNYTWLHDGNSDFAAWSNSAVPDGNWLLTQEVKNFDPGDGIVLETETQDGTTNAYIYDDTHTRLFASARFASNSQIAFTSFEDNTKGNWSYNNAFVVAGDGITGNKHLKAQTTDAYISKQVSSDRYEVSYWSKGMAPVIELQNGSIIASSNEDVKNGWTLHRVIVSIAASTGTVSIKVPNGGSIDEVRIRPVGSEITTYVYSDEGNILSQCDTNLFQTSFEYDNQYRPVIIRNHQGNITKKFSYHYRDQQ